MSGRRGKARGGRVLCSTLMLLTCVAAAATDESGECDQPRRMAGGENVVFNATDTGLLDITYKTFETDNPFTVKLVMQGVNNNTEYLFLLPPLTASNTGEFKQILFNYNANTKKTEVKRNKSRTFFPNLKLVRVVVMSTKDMLWADCSNQDQQRPPPAPTTTSATKSTRPPPGPSTTPTAKSTRPPGPAATPTAKPTRPPPAPAATATTKPRRPPPAPAATATTKPTRRPPCSPKDHRHVGHKVPLPAVLTMVVVAVAVVVMIITALFYHRDRARKAERSLADQERRHLQELQMFAGRLPLSRGGDNPGHVVESPAGHTAEDQDGIYEDPYLYFGHGPTLAPIGGNTQATGRNIQATENTSTLYDDVNTPDPEYITVLPDKLPHN